MCEEYVLLEEGIHLLLPSRSGPMLLETALNFEIEDSSGTKPRVEESESRKQAVLPLTQFKSSILSSG